MDKEAREWVINRLLEFQNRYKDSVKGLPPMKYKVGDTVKYNGQTGVVEIADFGGSMENDYHSYDISIEGVGWIKHIPEKLLE